MQDVLTNYIGGIASWKSPLRVVYSSTAAQKRDSCAGQNIATG